MKSQQALRASVHIIGYFMSYLSKPLQFRQVIKEPAINRHVHVKQTIFVILLVFNRQECYYRQ